MNANKNLVINEVIFAETFLEEEIREESLFPLGNVYVCESVLDRFNQDVISRRLKAHGKRTVGEYNIWLMSDEERSNIERYMIDGSGNVDGNILFNSEDLLSSREEFWRQYILEEKSLESIENDESVDSYFLDGMVIITTPLRKATLVFMEKTAGQELDYLNLDGIINSGKN